MKRGCSGDGGLTPRPMPPGGKIELAPLPPLDTALEGGSILVPRDVAPKIPVPGGAEPGGESPPERPLRGFGVVPITGPIPRPIPVVPRPPLIVVAV